jgi:RNA polymerase sigma-70 factor (ECF subfamily)
MSMAVREDQLKAWMLGGLDGSAADHAALLRALVPMLRAFYRRRASGCDDDIEDLVQETLIAIHTRRSTYDRERPFTSWLFAIARYKMIDHFRRAGRLSPIELVEDSAVADDAAGPALARLDIEQLLDTLPPKQSRSIRATRIDGLSINEAAAAANLSPSDVKISIHRGLKALTMRVQRMAR